MACRIRNFAMLRITGVLCLVLAGGGCAHIDPVPIDVDTAGMPNPEIALQRSMQHVDAEMAQLGGVSARSAAFTPAPAPIERIVDFTWSGPLDDGVAKLAQSIGYTFYTDKPPSVPGISVSVSLRGVTALDAFRTLGDGAGTAATVSVDLLHHAVRVTHHA